MSAPSPVKCIAIRKTGPINYEIQMTFFGHTWHLSTRGPINYWMLRRHDGYVWLPLKMSDNGRRMHCPHDSFTLAVEQAKFQILRLRYRKDSYTFTQQHVHQFSTSPRMENQHQELDARDESHRPPGTSSPILDGAHP